MYRHQDPHLLQIQRQRNEACYKKSRFQRRVGGGEWVPLLGKWLPLGISPVKDYSYAAEIVTTTRNEF